jgi:hypothetical protein
MGDNERRCSGCGKIIGIGDNVARVAMGTLAEGGFREVKEWGIMHRSCFNRAIGSPDAVLEEIRALRMSRKKKTG